MLNYLNLHIELGQKLVISECFEKWTLTVQFSFNSIFVRYLMLSNCHLPASWGRETILKISADTLNFYTRYELLRKKGSVLIQLKIFFQENLNMQILKYRGIPFKIFKLVLWLPDEGRQGRRRKGGTNDIKYDITK